MSKPFTETDFSSQITDDRNWRIKEISDLKTATKRADESTQRVLLRALVAICYAHWEGYIRFAARKYLEHIALRKLAYRELDKQFLRNYFLPKLGTLHNTRASVIERCNLVEEILTASNIRFSKVNDDLINTKANLSFEVFADICLICRVPPKNFEEKNTFIDVVLLKRRNAIAHGEETLVAIEDLDELASETIGLMRSFGDALENDIYLKTYKVA